MSHVAVACLLLAVCGIVACKPTHYTQPDFFPQASDMKVVQEPKTEELDRVRARQAMLQLSKLRDADSRRHYVVKAPCEDQPCANSQVYEFDLLVADNKAGSRILS